MLSPGCLGPRTQTQGYFLSPASPLNHKDKDSVHHTTLILRLVVDTRVCGTSKCRGARHKETHLSCSSLCLSGRAPGCRNFRDQNQMCSQHPSQTNTRHEEKKNQTVKPIGNKRQFNGLAVQVGCQHVVPQARGHRGPRCWGTCSAP